MFLQIIRSDPEFFGRPEPHDEFVASEAQQAATTRPAKIKTHVSDCQILSPREAMISRPPVGRPRLPVSGRGFLGVDFNLGPIVVMIHVQPPSLFGRFAEGAMSALDR